MFDEDRNSLNPFKNVIDMIYKTGRESVILSHEIYTNVFGCHSNAPCTSTTKEEGYVLSHPDVGSVATVTSS